MGSKTFHGVWFISYAHDHAPPHVHGRYAGVTVIVEFIDGTVRLAERPNPVSPANGKRSDVNHVLKTATIYADELMKIWRQMHG